VRRDGINLLDCSLIAAGPSTWNPSPLQGPRTMRFWQGRAYLLVGTRRTYTTPPTPAYLFVCEDPADLTNCQDATTASALLSEPFGIDFASINGTDFMFVADREADIGTNVGYVLVCRMDPATGLPAAGGCSKELGRDPDGTTMGAPGEYMAQPNDVKISNGKAYIPCRGNYKAVVVCDVGPAGELLNCATNTAEGTLTEGNSVTFFDGRVYITGTLSGDNRITICQDPVGVSTQGAGRGDQGRGHAEDHSAGHPVWVGGKGQLQRLIVCCRGSHGGHR
jgi:hypothetical protein